MKKKPLATGFASDNCDININTLSGSNTIHHTYGICYQNISLWNGENIMYSFPNDWRSIDLPVSIKKERVTNIKKNHIAEVIKQ